MSRSRFACLCLAAIALAASLVACGGGGGSSDQSDITSAINTSVKLSNPADCTKYETQAYMEQIHFTKGPTAVQACQKSATDTRDNPSSVDVTNVQVNGERATANVAFHGGGFDGSTLAVQLVKVGGQWKLDKITDIPHFDLAGFVHSFTARQARDQHVSPQALQCLTTQLNSAGADNVKHALISGDPTMLLGLIGNCLGGATG
jgi:hypothetical protein